MQEALTRVCNGTAHYSSARTLNSTEQPLFASAAKALCDLAAPYAVNCLNRIYPGTTARVDQEQALEGLKEVIQSWEQEQLKKPGNQQKLVSLEFILTCSKPYILHRDSSLQSRANTTLSLQVGACKLACRLYCIVPFALC